MEYKHPLMVLENVFKTYAEGDKAASQPGVLKGVSLTVDAGEFVVIFGPSGSGKSTMLNLMAGLEMPTSGRVLVRGRDLSHYDADGLARFHRLKMGMVFQSFNLITALKCWENVSLALSAGGESLKLRKKKALRLMHQLRIDQYADKFPSELSGGEQQRLAIARALINHPFLILADEPTGNLDSATATDVMDILHGIHEKRKTAVVVVTHNPDHLQYATRVVHVKDGLIQREERMNQRFVLPEHRSKATDWLHEYKEAV